MNALLVSNMYPSLKHPSFGIFVHRIAEQMKAEGISINLIAKPADGNKLFGYIRFYLRTFISTLFSRSDFIYLHFVTHSYPPVALALLFRSIPLIIHVHGADIVPEDETRKLRSYLLRGISRLGIRRSTLIIAPSNYFRNEVVSRFPEAIGKVEVSPSGGVDLNRFEYRSLPNSISRRILFLGRLIEGKGVLQILPAVLELSKRRPDIHFSLTFAGDGPLLDELKRQAVHLKISTQFLGAISPETVPETILSSHALIFPSYRKGESLGLAVLEAMACGRPIIAAKSGAIEEILADGKGGILFTAGDIASLSNALELFIDLDDKALESMSLESHKRAQEYSSTVVSSKFNILLNSYL